MPKVRRKNIPVPIMRHLATRIHDRGVSADQLVLFLEWLELEPEVPDGQWFKRFPGMTVCGEGELVKTFLTPEQAPIGEWMD